MKFVSKTKKTFLSLLVFLLILVITFAYSHFNISHAELPDRCKGQKWKDPSALFRCQFPSPPVGRWKAVYTEEFAKVHNLPTENVSKDLSDGVGYMEMDVQSYAEKGVACLVNMLVKNPNDIAFSEKRTDGYTWAKELNSKRKLIHLLNLDVPIEQLKETITFYYASRDYTTNVSGFDGSTFAFYAENALPGYDYITADYSCRDVTMHPSYYPEGYAFWVEKASVYGKYQHSSRSIKDIERPRSDKEFDDSHFFINVPKELIENIFKDVPMGGK